jgi:hypothetical protein
VQIRTVLIRTGTLTDSIGRVVAGVKGVLGTDTSLGSAGLAIANGIDSREWASQLELAGSCRA